MATETVLYPDETGPLEILLFNRYLMSETAGTTYGRIVIEIYPLIPKPVFATHGEVKCFFFGNVDASSCVYDDFTYREKTVITMYTPLLRVFKESEIPITITTSGINNDKKGIRLWDQQMQYKFHIEFYRETRLFPEDYANPLEVNFQRFIPSFRDANWYIGYTASDSYKFTPSSLQRGEEVYVVVEFKHPFPLKRNYLNIWEPKTYTYHIIL